MGAREGPAAGACVRMQAPLVHRREVSRGLPVPQLANIEVVLLAVEALGALPAKEGVARGVGYPLALDDPLTVVLKLARTQIGLEYGGLCLLGLQHERVLA